MNKTKKELYEENKALKETLETYGEFWERDAIKSQNKTFETLKIIWFGIGYFLLLVSAFLWGLSL